MTKSAVNSRRRVSAVLAITFTAVLALTGCGEKEVTAHESDYFPPSIAAPPCEWVVVVNAKCEERDKWVEFATGTQTNPELRDAYVREVMPWAITSTSPLTTMTEFQQGYTTLSGTPNNEQLECYRDLTLLQWASNVKLELGDRNLQGFIELASKLDGQPQVPSIDEEFQFSMETLYESNPGFFEDVAGRTTKILETDNVRTRLLRCLDVSSEVTETTQPAAPAVDNSNLGPIQTNQLKLVAVTASVQFELSDNSYTATGIDDGFIREAYSWMDEYAKIRASDTLSPKEEVKYNVRSSCYASAATIVGNNKVQGDGGYEASRDAYEQGLYAAFDFSLASVDYNAAMKSVAKWMQTNLEPELLAQVNRDPNQYDFLEELRNRLEKCGLESPGSTTNPKTW